MWDKQRMASAANMCYAFGLPGNRIESTQNASEYWDMLSHLLPTFCPTFFSASCSASSTVVARRCRSLGMSLAPILSSTRVLQIHPMLHPTVCAASCKPGCYGPMHGAFDAEGRSR